MGISRMTDSVVQYIIEAMTRIFGPSDDAYPFIGVQPFSGEPYTEDEGVDWQLGKHFLNMLLDE